MPLKMCINLQRVRTLDPIQSNMAKPDLKIGINLQGVWTLEQFRIIWTNVGWKNYSSSLGQYLFNFPSKKGFFFYYSNALSKWDLFLFLNSKVKLDLFLFFKFQSQNGIYF